MDVMVGTQIPPCHICPTMDEYVYFIEIVRADY